MIWVALLVKYVAESAWCYVRVAPTPPRVRAAAALRYGLVRLLAGRGVTLLIQALPGATAVPELGMYAVLVLVRWPLWSIVAEILEPEPTTVATFLAGRSAADRRWRAGGVLVSCLCDLPALLGGAWTGALFV